MDSLKIFMVYGHYRKDDGTLFYIGKGKRAKGDRNKRSRIRNGRSELWKRIVAKHGFFVKILFDNLTEEEAFKIEIELIKKYGKMSEGGQLANICDGGEGVAGRPNEKRKKVYVYRYKTGKFVGEYPSITECSEKLKLIRQNINSLLNGNRKQVSGFFISLTPITKEQIPKSFRHICLEKKVFVYRKDDFSFVGEFESSMKAAKKLRIEKAGSKVATAKSRLDKGLYSRITCGGFLFSSSLLTEEKIELIKKYSKFQIRKTDYGKTKSRANPSY